MADLGILDLEEGFGDSGTNSSRCLVGKVFQGKNLKAPILSDILKVAWRTRAPFYVDEWNNNVFLFRFENEEDRKNIIQEGPWSVMNNILVLIPLVDGMVVSELKFNICPFWIQIHGLPVEKLNRTNGEFIGKHLGNLLALEAAPDGFCLARGFLRVRVEINIEHPLPRGFWLRAKTETSRDRWISFKFEKLSDYCYACGRLGHDNRGCRFVSREEGDASGYGPELKTSRAKRSSIPVEFLREEVDAGTIRGQNLIPRRPEEQVQATGARVINDESVERTNNTCNLILQEHGVVERHSSTTSISPVGTPWTGVVLPRNTGTDLVPSLITPQGNSFMDPGWLNNYQLPSLALSTTKSGLTHNITTIDPNPTHPPSYPSYYVTEPSDSPTPSPPPSPNTHGPTILNPSHHYKPNTSKPNTTSTMAHDLLLSHNNNQLPNPPLKAQDQNLHSPESSLSKLPHKETHVLIPLKSPDTHLAHTTHFTPLNSTLTSPPITQAKPNSPKSRDISMSTVFNSLSLKRKIDDDAENSPTNRSKILRLCSYPTETTLPNLNHISSPSYPSGKPRTNASRTRANSNKSTSPAVKQRISPRIQLFREEGLCEVQIQQWVQKSGESNTIPLDNVMSGENGRVAGPEQPHPPC
ncbi:hypothetical protein Vadar_020526 [Vaccinium darrowii]|uniref:Uncharacterized protein n=1 Tax=Vaccinium darrowii TaxID=229202 RepID=A0ACB7ZDH8_9ERIC|nr:hypothetical protein Vadar_020526 [Vaccinium darrowii]